MTSGRVTAGEQELTVGPPRVWQAAGKMHRGPLPRVAESAGVKQVLSPRTEQIIPMGLTRARCRNSS